MINTQAQKRFVNEHFREYLFHNTKLFFVIFGSVLNYLLVRTVNPLIFGVICLHGHRFRIH